MLCQFSVRNYKSIRDEITLDLQAASISEHEDSVIVDRDNERFLPVSVLYGPNGGGKTTVLQALFTLCSMVLRPVYVTMEQKKGEAMLSSVPVKPYAFSEQTKEKPTEFRVFFRTKEAEYRYELHIKDGMIRFESLDRIKLDTSRVSGLFSREGSDIVLKGVLSRHRISTELSQSLPLLSYLGITYAKNEVIRDAIHWFQDKIDFLNYGDPLREMRIAIARSERVKGLVLSMVQEMDLDIDDFRVEKGENGEIIEVYTRHTVNGRSAELKLSEESRGTMKLFGLLTYIVESLLNGSTLVIDELDAKLHPLLLRHIIMQYTNPNVNRNGAQLFFTSHDLSTMNSDVFRRDEIWFVAKGNAQNSILYSLVEFKTSSGESVRKDARFDKQYLEGKYGADPYLRRIIEWGEING